MSTDWHALAARAESATGEDAVLDLDLAAALYPQHVSYDPKTWLVRHGGWTASLDAITALIEREFPEASCELKRYRMGRCSANLSARWPEPHLYVEAATPALALVAAFCRVKGAGGE
jgi:hypothetical protein